MGEPVQTPTPTRVLAVATTDPLMSTSFLSEMSDTSFHDALSSPIHNKPALSLENFMSDDESFNEDGGQTKPTRKEEEIVEEEEKKEENEVMAEDEEEEIVEEEEKKMENAVVAEKVEEEKDVLVKKLGEKKEGLLLQNAKEESEKEDSKDTEDTDESAPSSLLGGVKIIVGVEAPFETEVFTEKREEEAIGTKL